MLESTLLLKKGINQNDPMAAYKVLQIDGRLYPSHTYPQERRQMLVNAATRSPDTYWSAYAGYTESALTPFTKDPRYGLPGSLYFDGVNNNLGTDDAPTVSALKMGGNDFFIRMWLRPTVTKYCRLFEFGGGDGFAYSELLMWADAAGKWGFQTSFTGTSSFSVNSGTTTWGQLVLGQWNLIEVSRVGSLWQCFQGLDRQKVYEQTLAGTIRNNSTSMGLAICTAYQGSFGTRASYDSWFAGQIGSVEVYNGVGVNHMGAPQTFPIY